MPLKKTLANKQQDGPSKRISDDERENDNYMKVKNAMCRTYEADGKLKRSFLPNAYGSCHHGNQIVTDSIAFCYAARPTPK